MSYQTVQTDVMTLWLRVLVTKLMVVFLLRAKRDTGSPSTENKSQSPRYRTAYYAVLSIGRFGFEWVRTFCLLLVGAVTNTPNGRRPDDWF